MLSRTHIYKLLLLMLIGLSGCDYPIPELPLPPGPDVPIAPTSLSFRVISVDMVELHWHDESWNEDGFIVEQSIGDDNHFQTYGSVGANVTSYVLNDLEASVTYYYRVTAFNEVGNSSFSNQVTFTLIETGEPNEFTLGSTDESILMMWIDPDDFMMGAHDDNDSQNDELPRHSVNIPNGFWIGKHEVSQAQWEAVMGSNPAWGRGVGDDYPVYRISWDDVHVYIDSLNRYEQIYKYRLPSEAEWEYACRAGTVQRHFWGNDLDYSQITNYSWYWNNSSNRTHPVGEKLLNGFGLHDMLGNVWEWCEDYYFNSYHGAPNDGSAWLSPSSNYRVVRGGSWDDEPVNCRSSNRGGESPSLRSDYVGFRLVRSL